MQAEHLKCGEEKAITFTSYRELLRKWKMMSQVDFEITDNNLIQCK